jgi:hypothetical protein
MLCFKQETNQESQAENHNQESWVENQPQDGINIFYKVKLVDLKSCTLYKAKVELMFNNELVKDTTGQPIPSIPTPEFWTLPDTTIFPDLKLISQTEDSANFELTG